MAKRTTKKKAVKKSLGRFPSDVNAAIYAAKVLLASHNCRQAKDGRLHTSVTNKGTFKVKWEAEFEYDLDIKDQEE